MAGIGINVNASHKNCEFCRHHDRNDNATKDLTREYIQCENKKD